MSARTRKVIYPGVLGQPAQRTHSMLGLSLFNSASVTLLRDNRHEAEMLNLLLDYYSISQVSDSRYLELALCLARDHVPAFQKGSRLKRGRPKKKFLLFPPVLPTRRPGRPSTDDRWLPAAIDEFKRLANFVGRGADKRALEFVLRVSAKKRGKSEAKAVSRLGSLQTRLSRARKLQKLGEKI
jgi:hypothetical protein